MGTLRRRTLTYLWFFLRDHAASVSLSFGIMLIRPDDLQEVDHGWIVSVPAEHDVGSDLRRVARDGPVDDVLADADRADRRRNDGHSQPGSDKAHDRKPAPHFICDTRHEPDHHLDQRAVLFNV